MVHEALNLARSVGSGREALPRDQRPSRHDAARRASGALRVGPQRMTRQSSRPAGRATDREVGVVAAVLITEPEKAAARRLGLSHSTVKHHLANARSKVGAETTAQLVRILAPRLPAPKDMAQSDPSGKPRRISPAGASGPLAPGPRGARGLRHGRLLELGGTGLQCGHCTAVPGSERTCCQPVQ
jgi:DNA-binding CsgD family transcriptional regulator